MKLTVMLLSISRKSASIRSLSSGARICRKLTAPMVLPILKHLPSRKSKEVGEMKSFVLSPVRATMSKEKRNGSLVSS